MKNQTLSKEEIDIILNDSFDTNFWIYQLGISVSSDINISDHRFNFSFFDRGKEYWREILKKMSSLLCDQNTKEPKNTVNEWLDGDVRALVLYLASLITMDFNVDKIIAIPLIALIFKKGVKDFCANI